jgi:putative heme-binding domain-containing protein
MRAEAIDAISVWANPSVLDRVDGRLRGPVQRDPAQLKTKTAETLLGLLKSKELAVRISAVKAITFLELKQASPLLLALVKNDKEPDMRVESLKSLVALQDAKVAEAVSQALSDKERKVRVAGLNLLQKMNISKELMVKLLTDVISTKTMEEKQAAILTLGNLPVENSKPTLTGLLNKMSAGQLSPDLYLELGEAVDSSKSADLIGQYKANISKLSPDELTASYAGSLLGGDTSKGKNIFFRNQNAQCMKCHAYDDRGGNAGPRLNGIANRISREQILQALITPSARLSPGFGTTTLELKGGKTLFGIILEETKTGLALKIGDEPKQIIAKNQIVKRTDSPSSMPDMKAILTKKEIRDVVSFLATLKENN